MRGQGRSLAVAQAHPVDQVVEQVRPMRPRPRYRPDRPLSRVLHLHQARLWTIRLDLHAWAFMRRLVLPEDQSSDQAAQELGVRLAYQAYVIQLAPLLVASEIRLTGLNVQLHQARHLEPASLRATGVSQGLGLACVPVKWNDRLGRGGGVQRGTPWPAPL